MIFLCLVLAFCLEQLRALPVNNWVYRALRAWLRWCKRMFFAGTESQAWLVWSLAIVMPCLLVFMVDGLLEWMQIEIGVIIWSVLVLYYTMGFRQFSKPFTQIRQALEEGELAKARSLLAKWLGRPEQAWTTEEICTVLLDKSVLGAQRHVLGVIGAYVAFALLGLGPVGAVFYRMAEYIYRSQNQPDFEAPDYRSNNDMVEIVSAKAWHIVNWLPARASAFIFAAVGSFEDCIATWRAQSRLHAGNETLVLATAASAIHVDRFANPQLDPSQEYHGIQVGHLKSLVGLAWRASLFWLLIIVLIQFGSLFNVRF